VWNKLISSGFDRWADSYDSDILRGFQRRGITYADIWGFIHKEISPHAKSHLLEIGVGTGQLGECFGDLQVVGIDISKKMLNLACKRGKYRELIHSSANRLPFLDSSFDGIYTAFMFHSERSPRRFIRECERVLRPGGRLVVVDLFPRYRDRKPFHFLWSNFHSMKFERLSPSRYRPITTQEKLFWRNFQDVRSYYIDLSSGVADLAEGYMSHGLIVCTKRIT